MRAGFSWRSVRGTAHHLRQVRHISWLLSRERSGFPSENDQLTSRRPPTNYAVSPPLGWKRNGEREVQGLAHDRAGPELEVDRAGRLRPIARGPRRGPARPLVSAPAPSPRDQPFSFTPRLPPCPSGKQRGKRGSYAPRRDRAASRLLGGCAPTGFRPVRGGSVICLLF